PANASAFFAPGHDPPPGWSPTPWSTRPGRPVANRAPACANAPLFIAQLVRILAVAAASRDLRNFFREGGWVVHQSLLRPRRIVPVPEARFQRRARPPLFLRGLAVSLLLRATWTCSREHQTK